MRATRRRHVPAVAASAAVLALTSACVGGTRAETCVSWVGFDTPADAMADAALVVLTDGAPAPAGTAELFGADAAVHAVTVAEVLQGSGAGPGDELEVISTPVTCTAGGTYPDGDPLAASGPLVLFLHHDDDADAWRTITPFDGAVAPADDGGVPLTWAR